MSDLSLMQNTSWCNIICMRLNISNITYHAVLHRSPGKGPFNIFYDQNIDDRPVPRTNVIRDFGVHLDTRLSVQNH